MKFFHSKRRPRRLLATPRVVKLMAAVRRARLSRK